MRKLIKALTPPVILQILRRSGFLGLEYSGRYNDWSAAQSKASGYDDEAILQKVKEAALQVKNGEVACERDSVTFDVPQYAWASLSCLMYAAAVNKGKLSVLDFGGSLGSSYFTNRKFLANLSVEWLVVEQPHFVDFGKAHMSGDVLKFYHDIDTCCQENEINVIFLSSVLQYLEKPYDWLQTFVDTQVPFILLDRMPFSKKDDEFIQIQKVPASIYKASYPLHILSEDKLVKFLSAGGYELAEKFEETVFSETADFYPAGLFFRKK